MGCISAKSKLFCVRFAPSLWSDLSEFMPKERNKADDYREKAYAGDAQAQFATGWFLMTGTGVPQDERKGLKWIHKSTFQGYQPAIDYCKEHNLKWY